MAMLKPDKKEKKNFSTFAGIVNRECERFKFKELISNMFKCLSFVQKLMTLEDGKIRTELVSK